MRLTNGEKVKIKKLIAPLFALYYVKDTMDGRRRVITENEYRQLGKAKDLYNIRMQVSREANECDNLFVKYIVLKVIDKVANENLFLLRIFQIHTVSEMDYRLNQIVNESIDELDKELTG